MSRDRATSRGHEDEKDQDQPSRIRSSRNVRRKIPEIMPTPQLRLDLRGQPSAGEVLTRIRNESRDQSEKGRWFEQLFMRIALQEPEFEVAEIWLWPEWPEREALTGLDGRDIGIDLVAKRSTGELIAIQCKCYDERHILAKTEIDKFLGGSQQAIFRLRWAVATCRWGPNAQRAIVNAQPPVTQVDFNQYLAVQVEEETAERPIQQPWPLQEEAIEDTVTGLGNHDRGRLVMACGTGKTFTSLRIAQDIVDDGGRILFAAPTIALVSQARREWLRHPRVEARHDAGGVLRSPRRIRAGGARNLRDRRRAGGRPDTSRAPAHARRRGPRRRCVFCKLFDPPGGAMRARAPARKAPTRPAVPGERTFGSV